MILAWEDVRDVRVKMAFDVQLEESGAEERWVIKWRFVLVIARRT